MSQEVSSLVSESIFGSLILLGETEERNIVVSEAEEEEEEGEEKKFAAVRRREVKLETMSDGEKSDREEDERRKREMKKRDVKKICVVDGCFVMRKRFFRSAIERNFDDLVVRLLLCFWGERKRKQL